MESKNQKMNTNTLTSTDDGDDEASKQNAQICSSITEVDDKVESQTNSSVPNVKSFQDDDQLCTTREKDPSNDIDKPHTTRKVAIETAQVAHNDRLSIESTASTNTDTDEEADLDPEMLALNLHISDYEPYFSDTEKQVQKKSAFVQQQPSSFLSYEKLRAVSLDYWDPNSPFPKQSAQTSPQTLYKQFGLPTLGNLDGPISVNNIENPFYVRFMKKLLYFNICKGPIGDAKIKECHLHTGYIEMKIQDGIDGVSQTIQVGLFNGVLYYDGLYVDVLELVFHQYDHNLGASNRHIDNDQFCAIQMNGRYTCARQGVGEENRKPRIYMPLRLHYGRDEKCSTNAYLDGNCRYYNKQRYSLYQLVDLQMIVNRFVCTYMSNVTGHEIPTAGRQYCRELWANNEIEVEMPSPKEPLPPYGDVEPYDALASLQCEVKYQINANNIEEFALMTIDLGFYHPYLLGVVYAIPNEKGDLSLSIRQNTPWGKGQFIVKRPKWKARRGDIHGDIVINFVNSPISKPGPAWLEQYFPPWLLC